MTKVMVRLDSGNYPIVVSHRNMEKELSALLKVHAGKAARLFVVIDTTVNELYGEALSTVLLSCKQKVLTIVIPAGERSKSRTGVNRLHDFLLNNQVSRSDFVIAIGGGVISDLSGYAAATILRGIRWGIVTTTLLGMVDAAIGGKTGINHSKGKNLIGAFWQPTFVYSNELFLSSLAPRQILAGLGEIVKYAGLLGGSMPKRLQDILNSPSKAQLPIMRSLIVDSVKYKADIVSRDEREGKLRMWLNLGHTFGHGIEKSLGYGKLLHGEAILIGLLAATELSIRLNPRKNASLRDFFELVESFVRFVPHYKINATEALSAMLFDKKRDGRKQKFVLLRRPGQPFITDAVKPSDVKSALLSALKVYNQTGD